MKQRKVSKYKLMHEQNVSMSVNRKKCKFPAPFANLPNKQQIHKLKCKFSDLKANSLKSEILLNFSSNIIFIANSVNFTDKQKNLHKCKFPI